MFVGKYPPIQGGESAKLYWLARSLGARGHAIVVVSNFNDVPAYDRIPFTPGFEGEWIPPNVFAASTEGRQVPAFIPQYNPQSEKLASLGLTVASKTKPDLVIGWYLLPYAVAAHSIANILGLPLVLQHAGSDLARLLGDPQLNNFLSTILKAASTVLTYPSSRQFMLDAGCPNTRLHRPVICNSFAPEGPAMDLEPFGVKSRNILLFLGKASKGKGLEQLVEAFTSARTDAWLVIAAGGRNVEQYQQLVRKQGCERIVFIDTLPPWKIPELIRSAKAVAVPECNFGVRSHRSRLPIETLLCGRVPLVGSEIASQYAPWTQLFRQVDVENRKSFTATIETVMNAEADTDRYRGVAALVRGQQDFEKYVTEIEQIFLDVCAGKPMTL
jgi:glycosyltransferase involved in cell wall biosynthesis